MEDTNNKWVTRSDRQQRDEIKITTGSDVKRQRAARNEERKRNGVTRERGQSMRRGNRGVKGEGKGMESETNHTTKFIQI